MRRVTAALTVMTALIVAPVTASDDRHGGRITDSLERVMPLAEILQRIGESYPGDVLEVELEDHHSKRPTYEIKVLGADGRVVKLKVDARTADVLEARGKPHKRGQ